jgi:hypothetical protein
MQHLMASFFFFPQPEQLQQQSNVVALPVAGVGGRNAKRRGKGCNRGWALPLCVPRGLEINDNR